MSPDVAAAALTRYRLGEHRVVRLADSFNTVFRVDAADASYALRVGPEHRVHPIDAVLTEARWTRQLAGHGLCVPRLVPAADGAASVQIKGRECSVWNWVPGRPLTQPASTADVQRLAVLSARLHGASPPLADAPTGALVARTARYFDVPDLLAELTPPHREVLEAARDRAQAAIDHLWREHTAPPRLIHGDLTPSNVVRDGAELHPIDFQDLSWGHAEQDLAHSIYGVTRGHDLATGLAAFRTGYERVRPWPALDLPLLIDLVAARRVSMVNLAVLRRRPGLDAYVARHAEALRPLVSP